ncbi:MAG: hypothetical protein HGB00_09775 [Chlorobiaceae bacterium]|nr:hypothetical protein [Chlorobiaceae bacterium]
MNLSLPALSLPLATIAAGNDNFDLNPEYATLPLFRRHFPTFSIHGRKTLSWLLKLFPQGALAFYGYLQCNARWQPGAPCRRPSSGNPCGQQGSTATCKSFSFTDMHSTGSFSAFLGVVRMFILSKAFR